MTSEQRARMRRHLAGVCGLKLGWRVIGPTGERRSAWLASKEEGCRVRSACLLKGDVIQAWYNPTTDKLVARPDNWQPDQDEAQSAMVREAACWAERKWTWEFCQGPNRRWSAGLAGPGLQVNIATGTYTEALSRAAALATGWVEEGGDGE